MVSNHVVSCHDVLDGCPSLALVWLKVCNVMLNRSALLSDQLESPYLPPSCAAERSSPLYCWTPESMSIPGGHSSRKSWACQRKSTSRGAASISMSDWDVYEAGIQVFFHCHISPVRPNKY